MDEIKTYRIGKDNAYITCLRCLRTSYNRGDVEHRYCVACDTFHDKIPLTDRYAWIEGTLPHSPVFGRNNDQHKTSPSVRFGQVVYGGNNDEPKELPSLTIFNKGINRRQCIAIIILFVVFDALLVFLQKTSWLIQAPIFGVFGSIAACICIRLRTK